MSSLWAFHNVNPSLSLGSRVRITFIAWTSLRGCAGQAQALSRPWNRSEAHAEWTRLDTVCMLLSWQRGHQVVRQPGPQSPQLHVATWAQCCCAHRAHSSPWNKYCFLGSTAISPAKMQKSYKLLHFFFFRASSSKLDYLSTFSYKVD